MPRLRVGWSGGRRAVRNVHVKSRLGRRDRSRFLRRRCFLQNLTVAITRLRRSFYANAPWLAKALTGLSLPPRDQQAAYQPSGNGSSGQASPLSLAGFGG